LGKIGLADDGSEGIRKDGGTVGLKRDLRSSVDADKRGETVVALRWRRKKQSES